MFTRFNLIDGLNDAGYINYTMNKMDDVEFKTKIVNLVQTADIGIEDIEMKTEDMSKV